MSAPTPEQRADIRRRQAQHDPEHDDCNELALELLDALDATERERDRLARWKAEAMPLLDGLQDLGRELGLPLGAAITGPQAVEAAGDLRARAERAEAALARVEALAVCTRGPNGGECGDCRGLGGHGVSTTTIRAALDGADA